MKKLLLLTCTLLAALSCASYAKSDKQSIDGIVAIVNDDVVTKSEFDHAMSMARMQAAQVQPGSNDDTFEKEVLNQLINKKLQLQLAKAAGIKITDVMLNKAITHIAEQNQIPVKTLYERVSQQGMSVPDYRNEIREQLTLQRLQQQEVISRLSVSKLEISNFIKSKTWQDDGLKEYQLNDVLIPVADKPSANELADAKKRAYTVFAQLKQGQTLAEVTKPTPDAKNQIQTGDLGWRKLPEIPSAFSNQVARMQKKDVIGPIQTANGFHIIQLGDVRATAPQKATPTLKEVENLLLEHKYQEAMKTWLSRLRAEAFIDSKSKKLNG